MYPNQQGGGGYPQPGFAVPGGYPQQPGYGGYPQQGGYAQGGYPQGGYPSQGGYPPQGGYPGGPSVNLNLGPQSAGMGGGGGAWVGAPEPGGFFAEKAIRQAFISKVYSILTVQLVFTSILIGLFVLNEDTKHYFKHSQGWMLLAFLVTFITLIVLSCSESARRSSPTNFVLLSLLTVGYGLVAAITSCRYETKIVLFAFVATAVSCFIIAAIARTTTMDLTNCGTTLCLLGLAHMVIGIVLTLILVPLGYAKLASLLVSIAGAMLVSFYLIYDLQLIMGGRKCELSPEEYIMGAVMLYVDIIMLFLYLLEIFKNLSDD